MFKTEFSGDDLENLKFVSYDGIYEAVYNQNGLLCNADTDDINMGTYNFCNFLDILSKIFHKDLDVLPYITEFMGETGKSWGNVPGVPIPDIELRN
jgi:hypothetical protein